MMQEKVMNCYVNFDEREEESILDSIRQSTISGNGKYVGIFENALTDYFGMNYGLTCSSGTSAIELALKALAVKEGDEVILPPTAPVMTILPIIALKAIPVFVDLVNNNTMDVSLADIENKITDKTKAFINVPMWGYPNNISALQAFCAEKKVPLIEDASHCHGAMSDGKYIGTFGDIGLFSTHERKLIATGEGGFLLTNNETYYTQMKLMRTFGQALKAIPEKNIDVKDYGVYFGLNYKMSSINASLGVVQLAKLKEKIVKRTTNATLLKKALAKRDVTQLTEMTCSPSAIKNYYSIVFFVNGDKKGLEDYLYKNNIVSDPYAYKYTPLYRMPLFKNESAYCPNAEKFMRSIITLPVHEGINEETIHEIANIVKEYWNKK